MATYQKPHQYPVGIDYVMIGGEVVVDHGIMTGKRPGKIIRGSGLQK
jgi:hypothetical protein